jgi:hypothetical protein
MNYPIRAERDLFGRRACLGWRTTDGLGVWRTDKEIADELIRTLHYSHSVAWASNLHFVVEYHGEQIGALQFGPAMNPASGDNVVAESTPCTWLELNRMAFSPDRPADCATQVLSMALRLVRHLRPKVEWIQSFADERCEKFGAVYQAASFLYCGEHRSTFYELDGEWFHKSAWKRAPVDKRGWGSGPKLARFNANRERATAHTFRQFRYIKFLVAKARKNLLLPVLPYPKPA